MASLVFTHQAVERLREVLDDRCHVFTYRRVVELTVELL